MKKSIITILLLLPILASAQYFDVFDIDTSNYPIMKAKFYSIDANGKQILNHNTSDFEITENGEPRDVISVGCTPNIDLDPVSIAVSFDVSGSMNFTPSGGKPIEIAKYSATKLVNFFELPPSNIALQTTDYISNIVLDYTTNKNKLYSSINNITASGSNDFNEQLNNSLTGLLNLAKRAKYTKIAVIYTDAVWDRLTNVQLNESIKICKDNQIKLYVVETSDTDHNPSGIKESLISIAEASGGAYFAHIDTQKKASDVAFTILRLNQKSNPCEISWKSDYMCDQVVNVNILNKDFNLNLSTTYINNLNNTSKYDINPRLITFENSKLNTKIDTSIEVYSRNKDLTINGIKLVSGKDIITIKDPFPIIVKKNESKKINITFNQPDENSHYSSYEFITNFCTNNLNIYSGLNYGNISTKSLNITFPNGGEILYGGTDTNIVWNGITPQDSLRLNFSSDNGKNWNLLLDSNSIGSYRWSVPNTPSDRCLVRVSQNSTTKKKEGDIFWKYSYGGSNDDFGYSILETPDSGLLLLGSKGNNPDAPINSDFYLIKVDKNGIKEWEKVYGGSGEDIAYKIRTTKSGGYLIVGTTTSTDGDVSKVTNDQDIWVVKINSIGILEWQKTYGTNLVDSAKSFIETKSGDFVIVGASGNKLMGLKIDASGNIIWQNTYSFSDEDFATNLLENEDNSLIVVGTSLNILTKYDGLILKLDSDGNELDKKIFNEKETDKINSIVATIDGNYIFVGVNNNNKKLDGDIWVEKIDRNFNVIWNKTFGAFSYDEATEILSLENNEYLITGESGSSGPDITLNYGYSDFFAFRINSNGQKKWSFPYGGNRFERANQIIVTKNGQYVMLGYSNTFNHDNIKDNHGGYDLWAIKIEGTNSTFQSDTSDAVFSIIIPEPVIQNNDIDMGQMIVGSTKDTIVSSVICNTGEAPLHVLGVDITGGDTGDFLIPRGAGEFYLKKGECRDFMFEFTPSALGNRTAVATIRTTIGDFKDTIHIRGVGVSPVIEATAEVVDFGVFELGSGKDTTLVLIKNVGASDITITDTRISGPDTEQFSLLTSPISYTIPAGQEKNFKLNYTAQYGGRTSSILEFAYNGIGSPLRSMLFAEGIGGEVYPKVADAYVGETVNLDLFLGKIKPEGLSEVATKFTATVSYNSTLLAPIDKSMNVTTIDNKSFIKIAGNLNGVNQIATVPMKVGLGTAIKSGLVITEFQFYDANGDSVDYDIEPGVSEFNVLGICEEGSKRLLNPNGDIALLKILPNSTSNQTTVELTLIESGHTEVTIFDQIGNKIATIYSGNPEIGTQDINLDLNNYANGRYYVKLTTPTITKTEILEVVR